MSLIISFLLNLFIIFSAFGIQEGIYDNLNQQGMILKLKNGKYNLWINYQGQTINIQTGDFQVKGKTIFFNPVSSQIGDLTPVEAEIIGKCKIRMGKAGIFKARNCNETIVEKNNSGSKNFPKKWKVYESKDFEIYIPVGAKVKVKDNIFNITYRNSYGVIKPSKNLQSDIQSIFYKYKPEIFLKKKDTYFLISKKNGKKIYLEIVVKRGKENIISYVKADSFSDLKAISIAISSLKVEKFKKYPELVKWMPQDNSFSIRVPKGWFVSGGTSDFGANGYLRIVLSYPENKEVGFLGYYYPFYQYMQTSYGSNGIPPMEPTDYISSVLFQELAKRFNITFENQKFTVLKVDEKISQELTRQTQQFYYQYGLNMNVQYKFVYGRGTFTENNENYEFIIEGIISYTVFPLQNVGYMYTWGASPVFIFSAKNGKINYWYYLLEKTAYSWQVNMQWLMAHIKRANIEAEQIIKHYHKMNQIIHENSEYRMNLGLQEYEEQTDFENELFFDTFHALGGEERYDNPNTGEEIDVPIGADKYLYDNYSQTWIGIKMDNPDALDIINELKNNGFVELKKHRY